MCHSMDGTPPLTPEQQKFPGNPFASHVGNQANNIVAHTAYQVHQMAMQPSHTNKKGTIQICAPMLAVSLTSVVG